MDDLDPAGVASLEDLAACLRQVYLRADRPAYRELEQRTIRAGGLLPGTRLKRARLGRTTLSDVLLARKFPSKAFMLTFVVECGIDLENDRRWEQAWDRLAERYLSQGALAEAEQLRQKLTAALAALAEADQARQRAENTTQQEREKARSEIERLQAELITRTAELEQARTETAQALEAAAQEAVGRLPDFKAETVQWATWPVDPFEARQFAAESSRSIALRSGTEEPEAEPEPEQAGLGLQAGRDPERMPPSAAEWAEPPLYVPAGVPVCMPQLGEGVTEGTVTCWLKTVGERVGEDEPLLEVSTDKVDTEIRSPAAGIVRAITVDADYTVAVGTQIAIIEPDQAPAGVPVHAPHAPQHSRRGFTRGTLVQRDGTITRWLKNEGERVEADEPLFEFHFQNHRVIVTIPSPAAGILRGIAVGENGTVTPGAQVAIIEPDPAGSAG